MWDSSTVTYTATAYALNTLGINNDDLLRRTNKLLHDFAEWWGDDAEVENLPGVASVDFSNDVEEGVEDWRLEWLLERLQIEDFACDEIHEAGDVSADNLAEDCETAEVVTMDSDSGQCADVSSGPGVWHSTTSVWTSTPHIPDGTDLTTEEGQARPAKVLVEEGKHWHDEVLVALPEGSGRLPHPENAINTVNGCETTTSEMAGEASEEAPLVPREPSVANVKEGTSGTQEGEATSLSNHNDELAGEELTGEAEECSEVSKDTAVVEGEPTPSFGAPIAIEDFEDLRMLLRQHDLALGRDRHRSYRPRR